MLLTKKFKKPKHEKLRTVTFTDAAGLMQLCPGRMHLSAGLRSLSQPSCIKRYRFKALEATVYSSRIRRSLSETTMRCSLGISKENLWQF